MTTAAELLAIAVEHHRAGRLEAAEQCYRQALAADPNSAEIWQLLGVASAQLGRHQAGIDCLRRALALRPDWVQALYNLGRALLEQGNCEEAAACQRRVLELQGDHPEAHDNLGQALQAQGKLDEAVVCHSRAIELKPDFAEAHVNLGNARMKQGKLDEAAGCYCRALQWRPDFAPAYNNWGNVLKWQGRAAEATECYRRAVQLAPGYAEAHDNLGTIRRMQGEFTEAIACYRRAAQLRPDSAHIQYNLGVALGEAGQSIDEEAACYRRALQLKPDYAEAASSLLACLNYRSTITLGELAESHTEFDLRHCAALRAAWRAHENVREPGRCLRVGFVSRDLYRHPVGFFVIRLMESLDQGQSATTIYYDRRIHDDLTARFQAAATVWTNVAGATDEQLAEQIRADGIDILFDLAGHTGRNRLLAFARKPAPIQVTWCGYEGTTGLSAMDYILADRYLIPPQSETYYRERVLRMPDGYVCYGPPDYALPVSPLPAMEKGYVTFAAFHNPVKITTQVVDVWARVLERLPRARLVFKYRRLDDRSVAGRLGESFSARGVDPSRLEFLGFSEHRDYLASYGRVDIALDSFPFNGGVTTCDALWMGVPVVSYPGETFASRHGLSHLSNVGLTETIAGSFDEYVEIAVGLASDLPRLAALRAGLRQRVAASPLCDGKRFAENFTAILRGVWREWCDEKSSVDTCQLSDKSRD